jgi:CBS domain-containing protein
MLVSQVLKVKGDLVYTVAPDDSAAEAAAVLHERQVGAAVVLGQGGGVIGIFSERDLVRLIALQGAEGLNQSVSSCMTRQVIFAAPDETIDSVMARMTDRRIRHLPVLKDGRLTGIVSIGDMVKHKIAETEAERESLKAYIAA